MNSDLSRLAHDLKFLLQQTDKLSKNSIETIDKFQADVNRAERIIQTTLSDIKILEYRQANTLKSEEEIGALLKLIAVIENDRLKIIEDPLNSYEKYFLKLEYLRSVHKYKQTSYENSYLNKFVMTKYDQLMSHAKKCITNEFRDTLKFYSKCEKIYLFIEHIQLQFSHESKLENLFIPLENLEFLKKSFQW